MPVRKEWVVIGTSLLGLSLAACAEPNVLPPGIVAARNPQSRPPVVLTTETPLPPIPAPRLQADPASVNTPVETRVPSPIPTATLKKPESTLPTFTPTAKPKPQDTPKPTPSRTPTATPDAAILALGHSFRFTNRPDQGALLWTQQEMDEAENDTINFLNTVVGEGIPLSAFQGWANTEVKASRYNQYAYGPSVEVIPNNPYELVHELMHKFMHVKGFWAEILAQRAVAYYFPDWDNTIPYNRVCMPGIDPGMYREGVREFMAIEQKYQTDLFVPMVQAYLDRIKTKPADINNYDTWVTMDEIVQGANVIMAKKGFKDFNLYRDIAEKDTKGQQLYPIMLCP